ncbi:hypothetical protein [Dyadobacter pollutisoli]|uniref:Uncharacterized protein n=1 Tax=Dyadobacter pollutisoli TaxID=2910158 RepID=A0A9E8SL10_9BACT|nr:hypothetical protein [Dyadobacter pollutisoli]WAC13095.1 hypothetical protein ON006_03840 [Dyadobacter pollutisoli]
MKLALLGALLLLCNPINEQYQVLWCSETVEARNKLIKQLSNLKADSNYQQLNQVFEEWKRTNRLSSPIAVVRSGNRTFKWPSPGSKKTLFYNARAGVLGTRSMGEPSKEEISCFFQDTLVVIDTLRFYTGLPATNRFIIQSASGEMDIPFDKSSEELILAANAFSNLTPGDYKGVTIYSEKDKKRQEIGRTVLYLLSPEERESLKATLLNKRAEITDCEKFVSESLTFIQNFWGGKICKKSGQYDYAQEEALRRLITCP